MKRRESGREASLAFSKESLKLAWNSARPASPVTGSSRMEEIWEAYQERTPPSPRSDVHRSSGTALPDPSAKRSPSQQRRAGSFVSAPSTETLLPRRLSSARPGIEKGAQSTAVRKPPECALSTRFEDPIHAFSFAKRCARSTSACSGRGAPPSTRKKGAISLADDA
jgi:hypothetical protein